ncbi:hypothetical protein, partial [Parasaccharibacter apium]
GSPELNGVMEGRPAGGGLFSVVDSFWWGDSPGLCFWGWVAVFWGFLGLCEETLRKFRESC